ncbi:MAG TPA: hypothetical protein VK590_12510 [Saprospiraceae bacterium]|nr:hypothetical protein [Saprospiraceae bacterium]
MKSGKIVIGILVGLTAGAILAVLFAPKKLKQKTKKIMKKEAKMVDSLSSQVKDIKHTAIKKIKKTPNVKKALISKAKAAVSQNGNEAKKPVA